MDLSGLPHFSKQNEFIYMRFLFLLLVVILMGCEVATNNCCEDIFRELPKSIPSRQYKPDSTSYDISHLKNIFSLTGFYANFGFQFTIRNDSLYLIYLNAEKDSLVFVNLRKKEQYKLKPLDEVAKKGSRYCNVILGDTLHLFNTKTFIYTKYIIDPRLELKKAMEVNLKDVLTDKNIFFASNILLNKRIAYSYPYLFLPFGKYNKRNGMDKKAVFKIDINSKLVEKVQDFPEKYKKCEVRENYPIVDVIDSKVTVVFQKDDNIFSSDIISNKVLAKSTQTDFKNNYMCYSVESNEDLAFTSKYDLNDEQNINLLYIRDKYFLIKRLRKENKSDPAKCAILIYDRNLKYLSTFYPTIGVTPRLSFAFKNGIAIINDAFDRLYYYDFSTF